MTARNDGLLCSKRSRAIGHRLLDCKVLLVLALVMLSSCGGLVFPDNSGFPRKVFLHAEGDTRIIKGADLYALSIENGGEPASEWEGDSLKVEVCVSHAWLTVKYNCRTNEMTVTAEPNDTRKIRHAVISGMVLDSSVDIQVYQGK